MDAYEYPIRHFEMMVAVSKRLAGMRAQLLEHTYNHDAFGSWWFKCSRHRHYYRCIFDGRDSMLVLERSVDPGARVWALVLNTKVDPKSEAAVLEAVDAIAVSAV